MSQQTFNIHFILKAEKTNKKGLAPIFARLRLNGVKVELSTNRAIEKANWSSEKESAFPLTRQNKEVNRYLDNFKSKIYSSYLMLLSTGEVINSQMKVGNSKETLIAAMVQCYPYIDFPRISDAINILKDAKPE